MTHAHAFSMHYPGGMTAVDLHDVLADLSLTPQNLAEILLRESAARERAGAAPLTSGMSDFLSRGLPTGARGRQAVRILEDRSYAEQLSAQHRALGAARDLARSLSTRELADLLGRSPSTITRAAGRSLYAYHRGRSLRFPTWQLDGGRPLPGLEAVVPAIRTTLSPTTVEARMTTADPELLDGLSPVQWLAQGGDPTEVLRLLDEADHR